MSQMGFGIAIAFLMQGVMYVALVVISCIVAYVVIDYGYFKLRKATCHLKNGIQKSDIPIKFSKLKDDAVSSLTTSIKESVATSVTNNINNTLNITGINGSIRYARDVVKLTSDAIKSKLIDPVKNKIGEIAQSAQKSMEGPGSIALNPSIGHPRISDMSSYNLQCNRIVNTPSEIELTSAAADAAHASCSWICSHRYRGSNGRYTGKFNAETNSCVCEINDCKSFYLPSCDKRASSLIPTDGVNISSKEIAASMCPAICLMKLSGKRAEATGAWLELGDKRFGYCQCNSDDCK